MVRRVVMWVLPLRLRAVKAVVRSPDGRVLVVRHSYGSGDWMFPGGLVRRGERFEAAVAREMREELGIDPVRWEHLAEFRPRTGLTRQRLVMLAAVVDPDEIRPNHEIAEARFVDVARPPVGTSPATSRRLSELAAGIVSGGDW